MLNSRQLQELERQAIVAALFRICDPRGMENLKLGDTVQLKSGGPIMTVGGQTEGGSLICHWFAGSDLKHGTFRREQLKAAEPKKERDGTN